MKRSIITMVLILTVLSGFAQTQKHHTVYFEKDQFEVTKAEQVRLNRFLDSLEDEEILSAEIVGHADQDGSDKYNLDLSKKRADRVKTFTSNYLPVDRLNYKGEFVLADEGTDESSMAHNRRVEIRVVLANHEVDTTDIRSLLFQTYGNPQTFKVNVRGDTLRGQGGTVLIIPPNAFGSKNVELTLIEAPDKFKMLLNGLSTVSNDELLVSGGMIKLTAKADGREVNLADGKSINVLMPDKTNQGEMELFFGDHDNQDGTNWVQNGNNKVARIDSRLPYRMQKFMNLARTGTNKGGDMHAMYVERRGFWCRMMNIFTVKGCQFYSYTSYWRKEFNKYGVANYDDYMNTKYRRLIKDLGVEDYKQAMDSIEKRELLASIARGDGARELGTYAFSTSNMGWMNCDHYTRTQVTKVKTNLPSKPNLMAALIVNNLNSALSAYSEGGRLCFQAPKRTELTLIAIKTVKGKILFARHPFRVGDKMPQKLDYKEVELAQLGQVLEKSI